MLSAHQVELTFKIGQLQQSFMYLYVLYMLRSKVKHCVTRELARDVQGMLYLLDNNSPEIAHVRDKAEIDGFLALPWTNQVSTVALATYELILGC